MAFLLIFQNNRYSKSPLLVWKGLCNRLYLCGSFLLADGPDVVCFEEFGKVVLILFPMHLRERQPLR